MKQIRPAIQCQQLENAASEIMEASITAVVCHYWSYGKTSSMIRKIIPIWTIYFELFYKEYSKRNVQEAKQWRKVYVYVFLANDYIC